MRRGGSRIGVLGHRESGLYYFPFTENEDIFFYSDYLIKSFLEDLMNYGEVIFKKI